MVQTSFPFKVKRKSFAFTQGNFLSGFELIILCQRPVMKTEKCKPVKRNETIRMILIAAVVWQW